MNPHNLKPLAIPGLAVAFCLVHGACHKPSEPAGTDATARAAASADYTGDGRIDGEDIQVFLKQVADNPNATRDASDLARRLLSETPRSDHATGRPPTTLTGDFNGDGKVDGEDIQAYLKQVAQGGKGTPQASDLARKLLGEAQGPATQPAAPNRR